MSKYAPLAMSNASQFAGMLKRLSAKPAVPGPLVPRGISVGRPGDAQGLTGGISQRTKPAPAAFLESCGRHSARQVLASPMRCCRVKWKLRPMRKDTCWAQPRANISFTTVIPATSSSRLIPSKAPTMWPAAHGSRHFLAALQNGLSAFSPRLKNGLLHGWHRVPKPNQLHSNRIWKVKRRPGAMRDVRRSWPD